MKYFIGLDVYSNNTDIVVVDDKGKRVYSRIVKNFIKFVLQEPKPFKNKVQAIALECQGNAKISGLAKIG